MSIQILLPELSLSLPSAAVTALRHQVESLQTAVAATLRQNLIHNTAQLGLIRNITHTSRQIVQTFLDITSETAPNDALTSHTKDLVDQGLGTYSALAVMETLSETALSLLTPSPAEYSPIRTTLHNYRQLFLYHYMTMRDRQIVIAHESIHKGLTTTLSRQIEQEQELRRTLQFNEERYRTLFDSAADAIEVLSPDGILLDCNQGYLQLTGYSREEVIGRHVTQSFTPASQIIFQRMFPRLKQDGEADGEVTLKGKQGNEIPVWRKGKTITDATGQIINIVAYSRDLSERITTERELKLRNTALETAADAIVITDTKGTILWVNRAFTTLTQYTREEAIGANPNVLKSGVHDKAFYQQMWQTLYNGQVWQGEITNRRKDGSLYPEEMTITPIKSDTGEISYFIAIKRSIAERKRAERELELRNSALEAAADTIVITNARGRILYVNPAFTQLTQYDREEAIGNTLRLVKSGAHNEEFYQQMWGTLLQGQPWQGEIMNRRKDGTLYPEEMTITPVISDTGEITHFIAIKRSIAERKATEAILSRRAAELQTVAEISTIVANTRDQNILLRHVVNLTKQRFDLYHAHIYLLNTTGDQLVLTSGAGDLGEQMVAQGHHIWLNQGQSLVARTGRLRQGVVVNDVQTDPNFLPNALLPDTRAELAVPIVVSDQLLGVLDVQSDKVNAFSNANVDILTTLATQVGIALQNARSFAQTERALAELDILTRRLTREGWQQYMEQEGQQVLGFVYDAEEPQQTAVPLTAPIEHHLPHTIWRHPLAVHGEPIGQVAIIPTLSPTADGRATTPDAETAEIIAAVMEQLGARIENIRLYDQTQTALTETELLYEAGAAINTAQTYDKILQVLRQYTLLGENAHNVSLNYFERHWQPNQPPEWLEVLARHSSLPNEVVRPRYRLTDFPAAFQVLKPDAPTIFENLETVPDIDQNTRYLYVKVFGAKSTIFIPLVVGGQWWGYINAIYAQPRSFPETQVRRLMALAGQAAIGVQSIRLLRQAEARARQEAVLRQVTTRVRSSADVDTVLRTAVQEIGRTMGRRVAIYIDPATAATTAVEPDLWTNEEQV